MGTPKAKVLDIIMVTISHDWFLQTLSDTHKWWTVQDSNMLI